MTVKAYAKINLGLDVLRRRSDGYHDVKMIMQSVNLFDVLDIRLELCGERDCLSLGEFGRIEIVCSNGDIPCDETNLVYKAALKFLQLAKVKTDIFVKIEKNIPVGAGLAGGSADAAAVICALNTMLDAGFSKKELADAAKDIGADVPFCIFNNTYLAQGIGEILTPVDSRLKLNILLVKPPFSVSTPYVYKNLVLDGNTYHPDIDKIKNALETGNVLKVCENLGNTLESVTVKMHPEIDKIKKKLVSLGALSSLMSGSGPSVFGIFDDYEKTENAYNYMKQKYKQTYLTSTLNNV